MPGSEDDYEVPWQPNGMLDIGELPSEASFRGNDNLEFRNTFYWSKLAMDRNPGDFSKAEILHWLKDLDPNQTSGTLESRKMPLENRVWYAYEGQTNFNHRGTQNQPIFVGRVVDVDEANPTRQARTQLFQYEYDSKGNVTKSIDPVSRETIYEYDPVNDIDLLKVKQKTGLGEDLLRELTYNTANQPLTMMDTAGQTTTSTYNAFGQLETKTTPERAGITENRTTTYDYDADGYLVAVTGPAPGATKKYTYDDFRHMRTMTDSDDYTLTYDYDAFDRVTKISYPDGTFIETVYDKLDGKWIRDRAGRWTRRVYDALRRLTSSTDPLGRTVTQEWCRCGNLDAIVDPGGNKTSWERDIQGRIEKEIRANMTSEWVYTYEARTSRLATVIDPKNQVKTNNYFTDDNIKRVTYSNEEYDTPDVSFTYDPDYNRVATMLDGTGQTAYSYHPIGAAPLLGAGRLATVDGPLASDVIAYSYDELGRVTSRAIDGVALIYDYDELGRIEKETNALGVFTYDYEAIAFRLETITYPNQQTTSYRYYGNTQDRRTQAIQHKGPSGATLSEFGYGYDDVGNILTWTQQTDSNPANTYAFEYDAVDQLRAATWTTSNPVETKRYHYSYDPSGNRTVEQVDDAPTLSSYDNMNRLTDRIPGGALRFSGSLSEQASVTINTLSAEVTGDNRFELDVPVTAATVQVVVKAKDLAGNERTNTYAIQNISGNTESFAFDDNGNMTSDGTRTFEWDAENRLRAVNQGTERSEFEYDGLGRRVKIIEKSNDIVFSELLYLWCNSEICDERDSTGAILASFFALGERRGPDSYFYTRDHLASVREVVDGAGVVRGRYDYGIYGQRTKVSGNVDTSFGFTGHYFHERSGLVLAPFRGYAPELGRWLSEDPVGGAASSRYAYVANNAIKYADPLGLYKIRQLPKPITLTENPNMERACGRPAGGACIDLQGTTASVSAECKPDCKGGWHAVNVTLNYSISLVLYTGRFQDLKRGPANRAIRNVFDAAWHEFNVHVTPALKAVAPLVEDFENSKFGSERECNEQLAQVTKEVGERFRSVLRQTQLRENIR